MTLQKRCEKRDEGDCAYDEMVTFGTKNSASWFFKTLGALAGFLLALTSDWTQWVLSSAPFWFLGKISYTFYLLHYLIILWPILEMQGWFVGNGHDYDLAALYLFLIWTPVVLLLSWVLEFGIDTPSKNFVHALDQLARYPEY